MKKERFYQAVIVLLLVLNFGILGFIWIHNGAGQGPHPGRGPRDQGPDRLIFETLKLDNSQKKQFEILKQEHHSQMLKIQESSGELHKKLFDLLKQEPVDTSGRDNLLNALQANDRQKELVTFIHFQKLRKILHPGQVQNFDDFVQELSMRLQGPPGRP